MIAALKAELRKLLTVRTTYVLIALALGFDVLLAGYAKGYKLAGVLPTSHGIIQDGITTTITVTAIFTALIGVLLITNEYRYNTILYSLTANRSRTVYLAAKIIAMTVLSIVMVIVLGILAAIFTTIGAHLGGHTLPTQHIAYGDVIWRCLFYGWGNAMIALIIASLLRSQVAAIAFLFIVPTTVESLLALLLKDNSAYLPFSSLGAVITKTNALSYVQAAGVFTLYLVIGWLVAWALLLRRDAN